MIPIAFRIVDFKSIRDSHVCSLSADRITVLAGQNESGKTSVLSALRDFDLIQGESPQTQEYQPEGRWEVSPRVSVKFSVDITELRSWLNKDKQKIPEEALSMIARDGYIWITRDLTSGHFNLEPDLALFWPVPEIQTDTEYNSTEEQATPHENTFLNSTEFPDYLQVYWPSFVYFDSFEDRLPRQVSLSDLVNSDKNRSPLQPVHDFVALSGLDLAKLQAISSQDKTLGNYLDHCSANITGDFLSYWKTKAGQSTEIDLRVKHHRDASGELNLAFYVRDQVDQYPEQRSKGFLWFLSFYLRLAAAHKRTSTNERLLLIDEPGSYLHARAQQDVLKLLQERLIKRDRIIYSTHSQYH